MGGGQIFTSYSQKEIAATQTDWLAQHWPDCHHQLVQSVIQLQLLVFLASWTLQECFLVLNFFKCVWAFKLVWWHASPQPLLSFSGRCLQLLLCLPITASLCHKLSAGLKQIRINNLWMDLNWLRKLTLTGIISDLDFNKMIEPFPWFWVEVTDESYYPDPTVNSPSSEEGFWALW